MTLVLFDIDGTLLHPNGIGSAATRLAMQEVFGTVGRLAEFKFGGKTDWEMLLETLEGHYPLEQIENLLPHYDHVLERHMLHLVDQFDIRPCLGAPHLVARCLQNSLLSLGLLTANMPQAARLKLRVAGYEPHLFRVQVFGSEAPKRTGLTPIALERAFQVLQRRYDPSEVVVIGDTPEDILCAQHIGARVLAVATGRFSRADLAQYQPDLILDSLADSEAILGWINA
jgi:phosphoglycolate phosphatase-like HAD superfamily hydrolase